MTVTPIPDKDKLFDRKLFGTMSIAMVPSQSLTLDWSGCNGATADTLIQGVFVHTDGTEHSGCDIDFYVGDKICSDPNNAGNKGVGGVFNCGEAGRSFKAQFGPGCSGTWEVAEIQLWMEKIMSIYGTPYMFPGNTIDRDIYSVWF